MKQLPKNNSAFRLYAVIKRFISPSIKGKTLHDSEPVANIWGYAFDIEVEPGIKGMTNITDHLGCLSKLITDVELELTELTKTPDLFWKMSLTKCRNLVDMSYGNLKGDWGSHRNQVSHLNGSGNNQEPAVLRDLLWCGYILPAEKRIDEEELASILSMILQWERHIVEESFSKHLKDKLQISLNKLTAAFKNESFCGIAPINDALNHSLMTLAELEEKENLISSNPKMKTDAVNIMTKIRSILDDAVRLEWVTQKSLATLDSIPEISFLITQ